MNQVILSIINEINSKSQCVQINFDSISWRENVPSEAGWYSIKTNTPIEVLESVDVPKYKAHINILKTIEDAQRIRNLGIAILPKFENDIYFVYNGEANNLRARAREHEDGHEKTYCLGISNYKELRGYLWMFCYLTLPRSDTLKGLLKDDKLLRLAVEQGWRFFNGWPILCKK